MNKFKVGDIVLATADNKDFVDDEKGKLFRVIRPPVSSTTDVESTSGQSWCYYDWKFKKATKKQVNKFKFEWIVNKLKGDLVNE